MVDIHTPIQRSFNMSRVKSTNTKLERELRGLLWSDGIRSYRLRYRIFGNPDLVFPKQKIAVFIDGCFWHKCERDFSLPETRKEFWLRKIEGNAKRDILVNERLKEDGWKVLRVWQHEIKENPENVSHRVKKLI